MADSRIRDFPTETPTPAGTEYLELSPVAGDDQKIAASDLKEYAYPAADESKLAGIEAGATVDQTAAEIKTAYESNADTNAFTDADETKLDGIEAGAQVNVVGEAPSDGTPYSRQDAGWVASPGGGGGSNLGWNQATSTVTNDGGTDATLTDATAVFAGLMTAADNNKLATLAAVTAKGDLVVGDGAASSANLPVGTNGQVLRADSGEVTGVKWDAETAAAGTDLSYTQATRVMASSTGGDATIDLATTLLPGLMTAGQFDQLAALPTTPILSVQAVLTEAGTSYTAQASDVGRTVAFTAAGAVTVTLDPAGTTDYGDGGEMVFTAAGAGGLTVAAGAGVTFVGTPNLSVAVGESIHVKRAETIAADRWIVTGGTA